ncbi:anthocyanidin reductase ((2S)-flavan-3-ol-forming)-like [Oryza glaberrima]|uniref:anthocyanidin reductase ((2S)-flavan-3-ol-forming)-like n=1 Tax=Oryza glaberrima TaxID=4538 RepID=UPI00224C1EDB|nr:anthocyanidin reductase ((2S)-flavan-3-ol-forming)-like [Oryza glaberrima]
MSTAAADERRKTVCVTGGSGYIASGLIKFLLEKGYAVNTTVRNPDDEKKISHLKDLQSLGPLKIFRADLNEEGSFDEAITGCVFVFLVAAPVVVDSENLEEDITETNVRGTLNVMGSCVRARATVKRVVLTSSVAAVLHDGRTTMQGGDDGHVVVDESSWSDLDYLATLPNHPSANWANAYGAGKVRSEKEASRVARENGISLVTVLPVIVVGAAPATRGFNSSSLVLSLLAGHEATTEMLKATQDLAGGTTPLVHLRDVCRAQVFLAEKGEAAAAAGGRYLCCGANTTVARLAGFLAGKFPQYNVKTDGFGDVAEEPRMLISSEKLVGEGFEYECKNLDDMFDDAVEYGKALGMLP